MYSLLSLFTLLFWSCITYTHRRWPHTLSIIDVQLPAEKPDRLSVDQLYEYFSWQTGHLTLCIRVMCDWRELMHLGHGQACTHILCMQATHLQYCPLYAYIFLVISTGIPSEHSMRKNKHWRASWKTTHLKGFSLVVFSTQMGTMQWRNIHLVVGRWIRMRE